MKLFAYLDPGTGTIIVQAVLGGAAGVAVLFKTMGGRLVPSVMTITPQDKPTESTTIIYSDIVFDVGLDEGFFSLRNLKQQR